MIIEESPERNCFKVSCPKRIDDTGVCALYRLRGSDCIDTLLIPMVKHLKGTALKYQLRVSLEDAVRPEPSNKLTVFLHSTCCFVDGLNEAIRGMKLSAYGSMAEEQGPLVATR